jgi:diguanylate cyclase (GGDEF)-like protein
VLLARRVLALGIAVSIPVLVIVWFVDGPADPWVRWGYPPLLVFLAAFAWVLLRRSEWAVHAALISLVGLETWWVIVAAGRIAEAPDARSGWDSLFPTPLLAVIVCLIVGFQFQRVRVAVLHGSVYSVVVTAVIALSLATRPDPDASIRLAIRYGIYLGVFIVLLLVLSRAKERVVAAVADAAQADATASLMREMAYRDELTGIANRRRLMEELGHQAGVAGPGRPVGVVYFDLDRFKSVNDGLGHAVGDQALRVVAATAGRLVRDGDLLARLGGEEFVLVVPGADHAVAVALAERLRRELPDALEAGIGVRITASFGVAQLGPGEAADAVLHRVDELMYRAKADGRDQVHTAPGT